MNWNSVQENWKKLRIKVMEYQHEVSGYRFALLANNANGQTVGSSAPRAITNKLTQKKIELIHWPTAKIVSVESEQNNSLANTR